MWVPWAIEVGTDILLGFLLAMVLMGPAKPALPPDQQTTRVAMSGPPTFTDAGGGNGEVKISSKITPRNRCIVPGVYVGGRGPFEMMADSGAPDLWFTVGDLPKLGIKKSSLDFHPMEGEGLVAWVTLPEVRIGDFVARNVDAAITQRQLPESRLLGMSILKQGHVEVAGDTCTLTFPHNAARGDRLASSTKPGRPQ
jgi:clan AA aspartic protease (TIGR02281 family)